MMELLSSALSPEMGVSFILGIVGGVLWGYRKRGRNLGTLYIDTNDDYVDKYMLEIHTSLDALEKHRFIEVSIESVTNTKGNDKNV